VPHIGFNSVHAPSKSILFDGLGAETDFYFVHSFRAVSVGPEVLVATSVYGEGFVAAIESGNVYGTQFHPEKSQTNGLRLLANFLAAEIR
jgi:glutamine amidotransferase